MGNSQNKTYEISKITPIQKKYQKTGETPVFMVYNGIGQKNQIHHREEFHQCPLYHNKHYLYGMMK